MGCSAEDEQRPCDRLRQHIIDLRIDSVPEADRAAHRAAMSQALGTTLDAECKALTAKQFDCALAAKETAAIASCASTSPQ